MIGELLSQYIFPLVSLFFGALVGWIFEKQRKRAELKSLQADSSQKVVDLYQDAMDDLKVRYEEKFQFAEKEYNQKTANLVRSFEGRHQQLELKLEKVMKDQEMWKKKYTDLKRAFEAYRKKHQ